MQGWKDVLKVEYNDPHKYALKWRGLPFPRRLTRSAIYGSHIVYSHKWPAVLVSKAKRKPHNFEANLCGPLYSTFTSFQQMHFITNS